MAKKSRKESREISGISYTLERKRTSGIHMYIKPPDGEVLVTAPFIMPDGVIADFILQKASWIRKHTERFRSRPAQARMALRYETGETLWFWGRPYVLEVIEEDRRARGNMTVDPEPVFDFDSSEIYSCSGGETSCDTGTAKLIVPCGCSFEQREKIVKREYKKVLDREAEHVLMFWSEKTGLEYTDWHSRYMKTRWGSLAVKERRVCLSTRLAEKPPVCLVYVALHEIAHVKEANHGPAFKAILDRYMPSWRDAEKILKK